MAANDSGKYHIVDQGDHLTSIACEHGFKDTSAISAHPENKELLDKRADPNVLLPGDSVFIPEAQSREETGPTEQRHRFKLHIPKILLRIILKDPDGKPHQNAAYLLKLRYRRKDREFRGTTNAEGLLKQEIPADAQSAYLALDSLGLFYELRIGHLDPVREDKEGKAVITGVKARLTNLGFDCGSVDGELDPQTREAIKEFQRRYLEQSEPTGELDARTLDALQKEHCC
jgi:hypothetical protein